MSDVLTLSDAEIDRIADAVAARIGGATTSTSEILTRAEARRYVKRGSDRAFGRWCKQWHVRAAFHGRYSRTQLDLALSREARARG